ncbi:hypothetical protein [Microbispora bryophytorum]|uniref:hypothetical protein n=1 Tax=Microbispora bryophytorum TaxID=1460882 RepID=UPI0033D62C76
MDAMFRPDGDAGVVVRPGVVRPGVAYGRGARGGRGGREVPHGHRPQRVVARSVPGGGTGDAGAADG